MLHIHFWCWPKARQVASWSVVLPPLTVENSSYSCASPTSRSRSPTYRELLGGLAGFWAGAACASVAAADILGECKGLFCWELERDTSCPVL